MADMVEILHKQTRENWLLGRYAHSPLFVRPVEADITDCPECVTTPELPRSISADLYKCLKCKASWTISVNSEQIKYERLSAKPGEIAEFEVANNVQS